METLTAECEGKVGVFCGQTRDYAVRKLITMIAERDAAILERNSAIAEKAAACEERDEALLLRDVAYADRDVALEERDAAVAALKIAVSDKAAVEKMAPTKDSKLFQSMTSAQNCAFLGPLHPPPFSSARYGVGIEDRRDVIKVGDNKGLAGGLARKKKLMVKSSLDCTFRAKRPCRSPLSRPRLEIQTLESGQYFKDHREGVRLDVSQYPIPHCSCTGVRQQCYRWGNGGWQSSCCTTMISMYPLPMNPTKRGSRLAGRKMTAGAFEKLLEKLSSEGINASYPVDLKDHWAKHGTNRYVTLR